MANNEIKISLNKDEALVLFEVLSRYSDSNKDNVVEVLDISERNALWNLLSSFEKELTEHSLPNYQELLKAAKASLTTGE